MDPNDPFLSRGVQGRMPPSASQHPHPSQPVFPSSGPKQYQSMPPPHGQMGKQNPQWGFFMLLAINGTLAFAVVMMLFTFFYHHFGELVWVACGLLLAVGAALVVVNPIDTSTTGPMRALGALVIFAVIFGVVAGEYNYAAHMGPYFNYDESREYKNVLPSEPAAAHADAGKIEFASVAMVDTTKSVGYKKGHTYCVAPIMDSTGGSRVEFWAVGVNCCGQRNDFRCGDAGDPSATGGVVLMEWDTNTLLPSTSAFYHKAVKEAEAAFDLVSASEPLFIYWMKDPSKFQSDMRSAGIAHWALFSLLYALFNSGLAYFVVFLINRGPKY